MSAQFVVLISSCRTLESISGTICVIDQQLQILRKCSFNDDHTVCVINDISRSLESVSGDAYTTCVTDHQLQNQILRKCFS